MTKRYYYENVCDALYMAHHFGWDFHCIVMSDESMMDYCGEINDDYREYFCSPNFLSDFTNIVMNEIRGKFYLHEEYHKEVEPQVGDITHIKGTIEPYPGIYEGYPSLLARAEILQRDGKPFIMPMV